jgi:2-phospho-L-lactate guanylyltransferase
MRAVHAGVLVPVKAFRAAKARLAGALRDDVRANLAKWMAGRVLAAAAPLPVFVVCDDDQVASWADGQGATVLWRPGLGLNAAVTDGVATLAEKGLERVVVAHSDLPLASRLDHLGESEFESRVVLVPDRREDGTNVISLPSGSGFRFGYGAGSFARHVLEARSLGLSVEVLQEIALALDVDTPADLAQPPIQEVLPAWARTNPGSPR